MKKCFKCKCIKPIDDFYSHPKMADGRLNKCKDCTKKDSKSNRDKNVEYYREYDAWRFLNDSRVKDRHEKYRITPEYKESVSKSSKKWISENQEKRAAHIILGNSVRKGIIDKPKNCSSCGSFYPSRKIHAHHHDYTKPLDVTWLCVYCHADMHK